MNELVRNLKVRDYNGNHDTLNSSNRDSVRTNNSVKNDL